MRANLDFVASNIESDMKVVSDWYKNNEMVANPDKFQLMFIGLTDDIRIFIDINGKVAQMTDSVKLLGVTIDTKLNFNQQAQSICKKYSNKVRAFSKVAPNLHYEKMLYHKILLYCQILIIVR